MQVAKPRCNPLARSALRELQASGVEITPDIVVWLNDAANRIKAQPTRPLSDIIDWPVECGGVLLYPLSFGAGDWLSRLPDSLQNDIRVIAFACAHSRKPEVLAGINGSMRVIAAVSRWVLGVKASSKALELAVDAALRLEPSVDIHVPTQAAKDCEPWEYGAVIRAACLKYPGTSPDYWLWQVSREKLAYCLQSPGRTDEQVSEYEIEQTAIFRAVVESLKKDVSVSNG